jgi:hypothetical protein
VSLQTGLSLVRLDQSVGLFLIISTCIGCVKYLHALHLFSTGFELWPNNLITLASFMLRSGYVTFDIITSFANPFLQQTLQMMYVHSMKWGLDYIHTNPMITVHVIPQKYYHDSQLSDEILLKWSSFVKRTSELDSTILAISRSALFIIFDFS